MNGETWPKEEQRLCNGASGQVPVTAPGGDEAAFEKKRQQAALDTEVDFLWVKHVAREHVGYGASSRWTEVDRAAVLHSMVLLDGFRTIATAIRESTAKVEAAILDVGIENAGAIDSGFTVLGAGLAEGQKLACKGRTCRRGT